MKIVKIVNDNVNSGVNWSQSSVQLNDGQIVRIFNPVTVGDIVESFQNGKYTNWRIKKDSQNSDTEKVINSMAKNIQTLLARVEKLEKELDELKDLNINVNRSRVDVDMSDAPDFLKISDFEIKTEEV